MANCGSLGIPEHLHTNGKAPDHNFDPDELYYRRFASVDEISSAGGISESAISTQNMSGNRSKYSAPDDVLFNINSSEHFTSWGVWEVDIAAICELAFTHPVEARNYTVRVVHTPEECMYPHAEIQILENGEPVKRIKSTVVKTKIREAISHLTRITKRPR